MAALRPCRAGKAVDPPETRVMTRGFIFLARVAQAGDKFHGVDYRLENAAHYK
jgi:hypothetical protein